MPMPSSSPYQNLGRDVENQDDNAENLRSGVEDAQAQFDAAAKQYHSARGKPQEAIYNKAYQNLLDHKNRAAESFSKARELEVQAKDAQPKTPTQDFTTPTGGQGIEFKDGMDLSPKAKPSSSLDLTSLLKMAGDSILPSSEGSTLTAAEKAPLGPYSPTAAQASVPEMASKAASAIRTMRSAGVGAMGDKASVAGTQKGGTTDTRSYLISPDDIESIGGAVRATPEWQRQSAGLDDLDNLVQLQAHRNAQKHSLDLSPLGAYLDYRNAQSGTPTKIAPELKGQEIEDNSLKDMGEIQRRRADLSKELVNTIKAAKVGTFSAQDAYNYAYNGGISPNTVGMQQSRMHDSDVKELKRATDMAFKDNDEQYKTLNSLFERVQGNNPADIGAIPAILEVADTGSKRILAGILGMEKYDPSIQGSLGQWFATNFKGKLSEHSQQMLMNRLKSGLERVAQERQAKEMSTREYAKSLEHLHPNDPDQVVGAHAKLPVQGYPTATGIHNKAKPLSADDEKAKMKMFLDMVSAHDAGK